ncbi:MAG: hypothetical protein MJ072_00070 [Clostridia bacterium]|nr:hypothetical protein [Clostridia bacterium]
MFSAFEYAIKDDDARPWRRVRKKEQHDESGRYKKVTGWAFAELSGELGQRYTFDVWQQRKNAQRHEVTRGTHFFAFKNIFPRGFAATCAAFGITHEPGNDAAELQKILLQFSALCERYIGAAFLGKRPLATTAGALARLDLFFNMYGAPDKRTNANEYKKLHKIAGQGDYLRRRRIMRGGIVATNPGALGVEIREPVNVYDFSSLYPSIMEGMPDLHEFEIADERELFNRDERYIYIIVFDTLELERKPDMPAVFRNPFASIDDKEEDYIIIPYEFAIFADEMDELTNFYNVGEASVKYVLAAKKHKNNGYKNYVRKWYKLKTAAETAKNAGLRDFAKFMLNNAGGQLAKKGVFPEVIHKWDRSAQTFRLVKLWNGEEINEKNAPDDYDDGANGFLQGAYITAYARIKELQAIRKTCGDTNALASFMYADTDSIHATTEAPAELVAEHVLGKLKLEKHTTAAKYLCKKVYYTIDDKKGIDIHARGVTASAVFDTIRDNYGLNFDEPVPPESIADAVRLEACFPCPAFLQVNGGRARLYVNKRLTQKQEYIYKTAKGTTFTEDENGNLVEI